MCELGEVYCVIGRFVQSAIHHCDGLLQDKRMAAAETRGRDGELGIELVAVWLHSVNHRNQGTKLLSGLCGEM